MLESMLEGFNQTLVIDLAMYCDSVQQDWDLWLPYKGMANRPAQHEATKYMLASLLRFPVDLTTGKPPNKRLSAH
ncbi:hypothetical protein E2C01_030179 [Portunus trituberculatus]|uniref:Uncharacterized protein n=1 Tax=Portunus trituberculatus TaxID=210409 RepID=A0A5B7EQ84_PORTR|nr:hypothetical protein [Portunus trituberculatus]